MLKTAFLILFFAIVFFLADQLKLNLPLHEHRWYMLAFFSVLSFLFHSLVDQGKRNDNEKFIQFYLASVVIRLLACIVFVLVFLLNGLENKGTFLLNFFALYLCFTAFEIYLLSANLRRFS